MPQVPRKPTTTSSFSVTQSHPASPQLTLRTRQAARGSGSEGQRARHWPNADKTLAFQAPPPQRGPALRARGLVGIVVRVEGGAAAERTGADTSAAAPPSTPGARARRRPIRPNHAGPKTREARVRFRGYPSPMASRVPSHRPEMRRSRGLTLRSPDWAGPSGNRAVFSSPLFFGAAH